MKERNRVREEPRDQFYTEDHGKERTDGGKKTRGMGEGGGEMI